MSMHPADFNLEEVRSEWVGKLISESVGRYPVEYDAIRRHCHMTGDNNPLFLDPKFSKEHGPYGEVIVPPSVLAFYFSSNGPWPQRQKTEHEKKAHEKTAPGEKRRPSFTLGVPTPGDRGINMGVELEFIEPIKVGDHLHAELRVTDIFIKPIKLDPSAVWIVSEYSFLNQRDAHVASWKNTTLVHRSPKQIKADDLRDAGSA